MNTKEKRREKMRGSIREVKRKCERARKDRQFSGELIFCDGPGLELERRHFYAKFYSRLT